MENHAAVRRYDIDWLRVSATYLLLLFHVAMVFNPAPFYHIRNADLSFPLLILCGFISLWHMPLFFLLAGWSAYSSLVLRGTRGFIRERFFRLFVPLVAACVLLMPAIKYLELSTGLDANYTGLYVAPSLQDGFRQVIPSGLPTAPAFEESFFEFLPTFFADLARFTWAHMWFVAYLLTFTLLYLPLFRRIRDSSEWSTKKVSALWVYAPIIPLAIVQVTMRERWPGLQNLIDDWANFVYYSTYLIVGFLLARIPAFEDRLHREKNRALLIALAATVVLLLGVLGAFSSAAVILAHTAIAGWCYVVALLGWSRQKLSFTTPALGYLSESAFPVYVLHQSAIVVPGYFLIQLPLDLWVKFFLLLAVATLVTVGTYHFLVRPFSVTRFLTGMKARQCSLRPRLAASVSTAMVIVAVVSLFQAAAFSGSASQISASPIGRWYAEGGAAQVEIRDCNGTLCGQVVWLRSPLDENGCELRDRYNPDQSHRNRPVVGLEILHGLKPRAKNGASWGDGTIYDPSSGNTYRASLVTQGENRLDLRGYIGLPIIGRTTSWFRVGAEQEMCGQVG